MKTLSWMFLLALAICAASRTFASSEIPPESEAWLSVHFKYPLYGKDAAQFLHGRIGSGFELHRVDRNKEVALAVIFPNGAEPRRVYLQKEAFRRFFKGWERIELWRFDQSAFDLNAIGREDAKTGTVELPPFDDRTLVVTMRQNGKSSTLSIYAPEYSTEALKDRPVGKSLREVIDLFLRTVGEATL